MAAKGSCKGNKTATARSKLLTSVINRRWSLDQNFIKRIISDHIHGLIRIYNASSIKDEWAWDLFYYIFLLDAVTTQHFSQFQLMRPHRRSSSSPFRKWCAAFRSYMQQMFEKSLHKMNILEVGQHPCLRGSRQLLKSTEKQLGKG